MCHNIFLVYICSVPKSHKQKIGIQKNKLLRYQSVIDLYLEKKDEDIPTTVIWRKYIYPRFHISRATLYTILNTPVTKKLKELKAVEDMQLSMFPG